jgi:hypothetical protein
MPQSNPANGFSARELRTVVNDADGGDKAGAPAVRANPLKNDALTAADGADASRTLQSRQEKTGAGGWRARI